MRAFAAGTPAEARGGPSEATVPWEKGWDASSRKEQRLGTIVVKIGGSTLGDHDTTLSDLVAIQRDGVQTVVVHGGGKVIDMWLARLGIKTRKIGGLRVTDPDTMEVVAAALGRVNESLVTSVLASGGRAWGMSGLDAGILKARVTDLKLGLVGEIMDVDTEPIQIVAARGFIPVIAPVSAEAGDAEGFSGGILNVNADTAAGEVAAALGAERLVLMTDVDGVMDSSHRLIPRLTRRQARGLMRSNVVAGGMLPKIGACLRALDTVRLTHIVDGRRPHALRDLLAGEDLGTRIG